MLISMQKTWSLLLFLVFPCVVSSAVYKWVDQTGEVHYSDQRMPGAEKIELPKSSIYTPPAAQKQVTGRSTGGATASAVAYESLSISGPGDEETIHSNEQHVNVAISVQPALNEGDRFRLFLDGTVVSGEHTNSQITLQNVERGTHTLQVAVVDQAGKELIRSAAVTFFLRKISLLSYPGRPVQLPERPNSGEGEETERPRPPGDGDEDQDGEEEGEGSENTVRPRPDRPDDNPYAPDFRPNYRPFPPRAR